MIFGVPKEVMPNEHRIGLTPIGAKLVISLGQEVIFEAGCGADAGFSDEEYKDSGAKVTYSREELFHRADFILKIKNPVPEEYPLIPQRKIVGAFAHLLLAPIALIDIYVERKVTAFCYEEATENGIGPLLVQASEIAGRMMPQVAGKYLETESGGRGKLLMGISGVPAATVTIIGAGVFGYHAAVSFHKLGVNVIVLDKNLERLRQVDRDFQGNIDTMVSNESNIRKVLSFSDVVITAAHIPGQLAPKLITREMLKLMTPKSLIIDAAIDQGGNCETSRPTTLKDPTYTLDGIIHYCVPNLTSNVARTASRAHTNALIPILSRFIAFGNFDQATKESELFETGTYIKDGEILKEPLAEVYRSKKLSLDSSRRAH